MGIRVDPTFRNPEALSVTIERNTVIAGTPGESILLHDGTGGGEPSKVRARVSAIGNLTDDGSSGSVRGIPNQFRGPFTGDADAGQGPGSGFRFRKTSRIGVDFKFLDELKPSSTSR